MNTLARFTSLGSAALLLLGAAGAGGCSVYASPYGARYNGAYATQTTAAPVYAQPTVYAATVAQGSQIAGSLDASDPRNERGAAFDDYAIQLTAGVPVTITTLGGGSYDGSQLDVYTYLLFNGAEITHDDDGAGSLNSRIAIVPQFSGTYVIRVSTYGSSLRLGAYTLVIQ